MVADTCFKSNILETKIDYLVTSFYGTYTLYLLCKDIWACIKYDMHIIIPTTLNIEKEKILTLRVFGCFRRHHLIFRRSLLFCSRWRFDFNSNINVNGGCIDQSNSIVSDKILSTTGVAQITWNKPSISHATVISVATTTGSLPNSPTLLVLWLGGRVPFGSPILIQTLSLEGPPYGVPNIHQEFSYPSNDWHYILSFGLYATAITSIRMIWWCPYKAGRPLYLTHWFYLGSLRPKMFIMKATQPNPFHYHLHRNYLWSLNDS